MGRVILLVIVNVFLWSTGKSYHRRFFVPKTNSHVFAHIDARNVDISDVRIFGSDLEIESAKCSRPVVAWKVRTIYWEQKNKTYINGLKFFCMNHDVQLIEANADIMECVDPTPIANETSVWSQTYISDLTINGFSLYISDETDLAYIMGISFFKRSEDDMGENRFMVGTSCKGYWTQIHSLGFDRKFDQMKCKFGKAGAGGPLVLKDIIPVIGEKFKYECWPTEKREEVPFTKNIQNGIPTLEFKLKIGYWTADTSHPDWSSSDILPTNWLYNGDSTWNDYDLVRNYNKTTYTLASEIFKGAVLMEQVVGNCENKKHYATILYIKICDETNADFCYFHVVNV